ncbi:unnamed protein product [Amoebophrya sp. A120]|nr:unnamed protein product [Amoebophrya sp. A120]|eukprot:GSA120T00020874001.1
MDLLHEMRKHAGPRLTVGLPQEYIKKFLVEDHQLVLAIQHAHEKWKQLDPAQTYRKPEGQLIAELQQGWCHLYPEDTRNPYVPLAAKGPWIVTMYGAVLHDNGGYGMLGFGHSPDAVMKAMSEDVVMANIMTPALGQKQFIDALHKEIGHNRPDGCPFSGFLLMNSGSEGNSVADRLIDIHTGTVMAEPENRNKKVKCVALKGCFHGRTYRPALWTDACHERYSSAGVYSIMKSYEEEYCWICEVNDCADLQRLFDKAVKENCFIEAMFVESVMGEGNPGVAITAEFFAKARDLTLKHNSMLLVDNIQAGIRTTGNLSIVDYPGFEKIPGPPDFEVYSKAINAGQYPVYALRICLGLETCDAELCTTEILPKAAKHDKAAEHFAMRSPHDKLRFYMTQEGVSSLVMQYRSYRNVELHYKVHGSRPRHFCNAYGLLPRHLPPRAGVLQARGVRKHDDGEPAGVLGRRGGAEQHHGADAQEHRADGQICSGKVQGTAKGVPKSDHKRDRHRTTLRGPVERGNFRGGRPGRGGVLAATAGPGRDPRRTQRVAVHPAVLDHQGRNRLAGGAGPRVFEADGQRGGAAVGTEVAEFANRVVARHFLHRGGVVHRGLFRRGNLRRLAGQWGQ